MGNVITQDLSHLRAGEDDVVRVLEQDLPDSWDVVCTLAFPAGDDSRELDVVAISDRGVYVIEVKHHRGHLEISSNSLARSGRHLDNPYYQVDGAAKAFRSYLDRRCDDFGQQPGKPVHAHIVLSNRDARLVRVQDEIEHQVSTLETLVEDLLARDEGLSHDLTAIRPRLRNVLSTADMRDAVPDRILSWTIGERLSTSRAIRTFTAVHDDGSEYLVRLLRPKNTLDRTYAQRERDGLLREYETLRQLSALDVCPTVQPYQELDEGEFLVPIQAVDGRSLAQEIRDGVQPDGDRVREVVAGAFRALAIVHEADPSVTHRAITPERVIVAPNGTIRFTDFQIAHIDERTGLTTVLGDIDPDDEQTHYWRAPEARRELAYATSHSDVWALATTLRAWVIGSTRSGHLKKHTLPGEVQVRLGEIADAFSDLLREARVDRATGRPTAREIADAWGPVEGSAPADVSEETVHTEPELPLCHRELEPGDVIGGRYELVEQLGIGATAVTYLVRDLDVDEQVVLKSFDFASVPESLALQEFKKAKELIHERIATVREFHRPEHPFHLVVDHAPGRELRAWEDRFVGDAEALLALGTSLLEALAYIHDKGYLHRDVSPRNVIVSDHDPRELKVIDFGLSALRGDASSPAYGTFGYVAPEVVRGEDWTTAADVYSAGVVLYEALAGEKPFPMDPAPVHDDLRPAPDHFGEAVRRLAELLLTAVQPDPAARYPDGGEFLAALQDLVIGDADVTDTGDAGEAPPSDVAAEGPPEDRTDEPWQGGTPTQSAWLTGLFSLDDEDPRGDETDASPPAPEEDEETVAGHRFQYVSEIPPISRTTRADAPARDETSDGEPSEIRVLWTPDRPVRPDGNCTFGVGRIRKYSLGLDGTVRGVLPAGGRERTLYARVPDDFVAMVNAAKRAGGQSHGGSFVIDHAGNVLVGTGRGTFLAGRVDGLLCFEDGGRLLSAAPDDGLEPGMPWEGLRAGLRYKLNASTSDIAYESLNGVWVWLTDRVGSDEAHRVASSMGRVKPGGGRVYVNEAGAAFGPVQKGQEWREVYLGRVGPASWF